MKRLRTAPERLAEAAPAAKPASTATGKRKKRKADALQATSPAKAIKRTALSQNKKIQLFGEYSVLVAAGKPAGSVTALAKQYGVGSKYPARLYAQIMDGGGAMDGRDGMVQSKVIDEQAAKEIEGLLETNNYELTYKQIGEYTGFAESTVGDHCRRSGYRQTEGQTAPLLNEDQMASRVRYCKRHKRSNFDLHVDVDEKWAYAYRRVKKKIPQGKTAPRKKILSKRYIPKVMILTAIARPVPEQGFDGMVGCWRVAETAFAKNKSKNRDAGAEITVDVNLDGKVWRRMVGLIFGAIRRKMSWARSVDVQWDNAPAHNAKASTKYVKSISKARAGGPDINVVEQPAKSPDMNSNDLGFYNSLDSKIPNPRPFDLDTLYSCFHTAFKKYDSQLLNKIFDTRKRILKEVLKVKGSNEYKMHRSNKK